MPYIVTREDKDLGLKLGQELKHEQGKLPTALKFVAAWNEDDEPSLAEQYEAKAGKKPDGRWSDEKIAEELEKLSKE